VNRAMEELTGYTRKELMGQPCTILDCDVCLVSGPTAAKEKKCDLFRTGQVSRRRCEFAPKGRPPALRPSRTPLFCAMARVTS
jgi:two-component system response regulator HydG